MDNEVELGRFREEVASKLRVVPGFPKEGIMFEDVTPVLADGRTFDLAATLVAEAVRGLPGGVSKVLGVDARGFIFGAMAALGCGCGFLMARKPGKLPVPGARRAYGLEYGRAELELSADGVRGERVAIVDDLLATGGTAEAAGALVRELGGEVAGYVFLVELSGLGGRERLGDAPVVSVLVR